MLKLERTPELTQREWARQVAYDGVVYTRPREWGLPLVNDYRRGLPEKGEYHDRRPRRACRHASRLVQLGGYPNRRGQERYYVAHHRHHARWLKWSERWLNAAQRGGYLSSVGPVFQPYKQNNPLLLERRPVWVSPLLGRLQREPLLGVSRREVDFDRRDARLERAHLYFHWHFGGPRRSKKWTPVEVRTFRFRRKRLRKYVFRRPTYLNYFRGVTRSSFDRVKTNRFHWLEKQKLLLQTPAPYYQWVFQWHTYMFKSRVNLPLEYNLDRAQDGYFRLTKRRRLIGRRWKLGQHPEWSVYYRQARDLRWKWFGETFLGAQLPQFRESAELQRTDTPPLTPGFFASVYWSVQKWGRSRWRTHPVDRARWVFVDSVKSGLAVEPDALQWGRASTSATGILASLSVQTELYPAPRVHRPSAWLRWYRAPSWSSNLNSAVLRWYAKSLPLVWYYGVTPVWRVYSMMAQAWLRLGYFLRLLPGRSWLFLSTPFFFLGTLFRELTHPIGVYLTHWVKERRLFKTLAWTYNAWLLVYTLDNDQSELEVFGVDEDHTDRMAVQEADVDANEEYDLENDQMGEGIHKGAPPKPFTSQWLPDVDSFIHEWFDVVEDLVCEELPYRFGLFLRPWIDFLFRLPFWSFLDLFFLWGATCKLEYQRNWTEILRLGNTPQRVKGRWWKVPLLVLAYLVRWGLTLGLTWLLVTQMEYSSFRIWITYSLGLVWYEEYYVGWLVICFLISVNWVGPTSWKNYFFQEVGLTHWVGLWVGTTMGVDTEEYFPHTRLGTLEKHFNRGWVTYPMKIEVVANRTLLTDREYELTYFNHARYDDVRVVLAQMYQPDSPFTDPDEIEHWGFVWPFDRSVDEPSEIYVWPQDFARETRARLGPHQPRSNFYDLDFDDGGLSFDYNNYFPDPPPDAPRQADLETRNDTTVANVL